MKVGYFLGFGYVIKPAISVIWSLLTYLLSPYNRVLLEKLTDSQLVYKFPAFYGTRKFITEFTGTLHLSLSWAITIQSMPSKSTSWRSSLIRSSHLRLDLPSGPFPSGFPTNIPVYTSALPICATCPAHYSSRFFITRIILGEEYRSLRSSVWIFLYSPVISCLLVSNNLLRTLNMKFTAQNYSLTLTPFFLCPRFSWFAREWLQTCVSLTCI